MQMPTQYKHTQFATLTISVLIAGAVVLGIIGSVTGWRPVSSAVLVILLACVVLFYSLTAEIRNGHLEIRFGIGLIRKRFDLKEIEKAYPVRNHWYYGWGIRLIPHGWLFNVSGLDAVEIAMSSGKRYRIGTDQRSRWDVKKKWGLESEKFRTILSWGGCRWFCSGRS